MASIVKKCSVRVLLVLILLVVAGCQDISDNSISAIDFSSENVYVHFIDVGQGDCAIVQTTAGNMLIDAGIYESEQTIIDYLDSLDITEFEYAIFTHPHEDHIGSAVALLEKYSFNSIVMPDAVAATPSFDNLIYAIEQEECNVILAEADKTFNIGDVKVELLAPDYYYDKSDLNNMSVVSKVSFHDISFLFTGDAEEISEDSMIYYGYDLDADILKVGHHGSSTSSTQKFTEAVSPAVAIVSAGKDNEYGHPHYEVVKRLESVGAEIYITYDVGNVIVSTDGVSFDIITEK